MQELLQVLDITLPVFLLIGFGWLLRRTRMLPDSALHFLNRFVYLFSLPLLIFLNVAGENFRELLNVPIFVVSGVCTVVLAAATWLACRRLRSDRRSAMAVSPFWGNVSYLGFPICEAAYGAAGLKYAAIFNAFAMPIFVISGVSLYSIGHETKQSWRRTIVRAVTNPIVLAAVLGIVTSLGIHQFDLENFLDHQDGATWRHLPGFIVGILVKAGMMVGKMGLPLALIAVGASLHMGKQVGRWGWIAAGTIGALVVAPAMAWGLAALVFPAMDLIARNVLVLEMAMPLAVASWVIGRETQADGDLLANLLVASTAGASVSLPAWLYVLGRFG